MSIPISSATPFVAAKRTVSVLLVGSRDAVESTTMVSWTDSKHCARCMIGVATNTAQEFSEGLDGQMTAFAVTTMLPGASDHSAILFHRTIINDIFRCNKT